MARSHGRAPYGDGCVLMAMRSPRIRRRIPAVAAVARPSAEGSRKREANQIEIRSDKIFFD